MQDTVGTIIGPYRVTRPIGHGGMGSVFEATHQQIGRRVAIKILLQEHARDKETVTRLFNEARAVNRIEHPGLVQISDYGQLPDGMAYIVMEYLKGETLGQRLKRASGRMGASEVIRLGRQICTAIAAAHDKDIVHRDLKPDKDPPSIKPGNHALRRAEAPQNDCPPTIQVAPQLKPEVVIRAGGTGGGDPAAQAAGCRRGQDPRRSPNLRVFCEQ